MFISARIQLPDALPLDTLLVDDAPKPKNTKKKDDAARGRGKFSFSLSLVPLLCAG